MEESKATVREPANGAIMVFKGLAIMIGSVLAIIAGMISPFGEALFFVFSILAGKNEKKRRNGEIKN